MFMFMFIRYSNIVYNNNVYVYNIKVYVYNTKYMEYNVYNVNVKCMI